MLYKIHLKNTKDKSVILSEEAYNYFKDSEYFIKINFLENLRLHSSGYAFYQKNYPLKDGSYKNVTIYVHKAIAEKFIPKPTSNKKLFVRIINGNPLDCRLNNLEWVSMSELRRNQKHSRNITGYRGVVQVSKNRYRAVIYNKNNRIDLGLFPTAEEAALAYNRKSKEIFGTTDSLNKVN